MAGNPRRNALFGVVPETLGFQGLGGGGTRAQTGDPPPSHRTTLLSRAGNGNLRCRDGHAKAGLSPSRDQSRDVTECEKPPFWRNKCEKADGSLSPRTGWWCAQPYANRSPPAPLFFPVICIFSGTKPRPWPLGGCTPRRFLRVIRG
jgi:hypothetical protein